MILSKSMENLKNDIEVEEYRYKSELTGLYWNLKLD